MRIREYTPNRINRHWDPVEPNSKLAAAVRRLEDHLCQKKQQDCCTLEFAYLLLDGEDVGAPDVDDAMMMLRGVGEQLAAALATNDPNRGWLIEFWDEALRLAFEAAFQTRLYVDPYWQPKAAA